MCKYTIIAFFEVMRTHIAWIRSTGYYYSDDTTTTIPLRLLYFSLTE